MIGLTLYDYLLFPLYLVAVFYIFKKLRQRYSENKNLYFYFTWGFRIKIFIIIVYTLLSHFVIRGDAVDLYFGEGKRFAQYVKDDYRNIDLLFTKAGKTTDELASDDEKGYLAVESNYMVVKVCILLCFVSFSCFSVINLIIGFIAFLGSWQLYLFFLKQYPKLHKEFAFACLGIPTVLFWSAGISKDTICLTSLAVFTKCFYDISKTRKKMLRNTVLIIIAVYLIYQIKSYILMSYLPFFLLFLIISKINETQIPIIRYALKLSIPLLLAGIVVYIIANSEDLFKDYSSDKILENISGKQSAFNAQSQREVGSYFTLGEFDGSISGLVNMAPKAVIATFFRPFIWESRNLVMILSSLEAMALFIFTVYVLIKGRFIHFFSILLKNSTVFYCLAFSFFFAIFVGISTYNFGSLVRYKIPCIPFYVSSLFIINYLRQQRVKAADTQQAIAKTGEISPVG